MYYPGVRSHWTLLEVGATFCLVKYSGIECMNSLIVYSVVMAVFALADLVSPGLGSFSLDLGIAMIMLGFGLAAKNGRKV